MCSLFLLARSSFLSQRVPHLGGENFCCPRRLLAPTFFASKNESRTVLFRAVWHSPIGHPLNRALRHLKTALRGYLEVVIKYINELL